MRRSTLISGLWRIITKKQGISCHFRAGSADNEPRVRHVIKRTPVRNGSGCAANVASARRPEEPLQHRLDVAGANPLFHRRSEPRGCMVVSMPSHHVAGAPDLRRTLAGKPLFDVRPGQMHRDHVSFHRLQRPHAKVRQAQLGLCIKVHDLTGPAATITTQGLDDRAGQVRTGKVRPGTSPGMPFGKHHADIKGNFRQPSHGIPHVVGRRVPVRSGHADPRVPLVP